MSLPAIVAARRFDASAHLPFYIDRERVGWIRRTDAPALRAWPDVFHIDQTSIRLADTFSNLNARSAALGAVIGMLAADGRIPGWRNETYAIRNAFDAEPLAFIERAASRFFGTMTYAVHLNGIVEEPGRAPQLWIARRSETKATDPGMLDNVVAGGVGWGMGIEETLVKECWEEAGMQRARIPRAAIAARRHAGRADQRFRPELARRFRAAQSGWRSGRTSARAY